MSNFHIVICHWKLIIIIIIYMQWVKVLCTWLLHRMYVCMYVVGIQIKCPPFLFLVFWVRQDDNWWKCFPFGTCYHHSWVISFGKEKKLSFIWIKRASIFFFFFDILLFLWIQMRFSNSVMVGHFDIVIYIHTHLNLLNALT